MTMMSVDAINIMIDSITILICNWSYAFLSFWTNGAKRSEV